MAGNSLAFAVTFEVTVTGLDRDGRLTGTAFLYRGSRFVSDAKAWAVTQPEALRMAQILHVEAEVVCPE